MKSIINHIKRFILLKPEIINANFKYQLLQEVYFLRTNTITRGNIVQCNLVLNEDITMTSIYGIAYGVDSKKYLPESMIFVSKEELAQSLLKD